MSHDDDNELGGPSIENHPNCDIHATQECLVQNGVLNRAVSEAAGKGVPGLALDDAVDSQVVFEFSTGVLLILRFEVCINKCSAGSENVVTS